MPRFEELLEDFFYRPDEPLGAPFEPHLGEALLPTPVEVEPPREYLAFSLGEETYAVPIERVRQILKVPPLTEVPRAARELLGVLNLRGEVLPVYDLELCLGLSTEPAPVAGPDADFSKVPRTARILIVHAAHGDAGLLVDAVHEAVKLVASAIEPPPRGLSSGERATISGIGRRRDALFILLDLEQTLP